MQHLEHKPPPKRNGDEKKKQKDLPQTDGVRITTEQMERMKTPEAFKEFDRLLKRGQFEELVKEAKERRGNISWRELWAYCLAENMVDQDILVLTPERRDEIAEAIKLSPELKTDYEYIMNIMKKSHPIIEGRAVEVEDPTDEKKRIGFQKKD